MKTETETETLFALCIAVDVNPQNHALLSQQHMIEIFAFATQLMWCRFLIMESHLLSQTELNLRS